VAILEDILEARTRGLDWLLKMRNPDGSIGPYEKGLFYYRVPWAFAVTGRDREASMLLQWIRENMFTEEGDFAGKYSRGDWVRYYYSYPNANIIYGAHILRQFDLSYKGMRFLLTLQDRESGGFFDEMSEDGPCGEEDIWCSSQAGLTCLVTGHVKEAELVASFLEMIYESQPDIAHRLYHVYSPGKGLVTEFPEEKAKAYYVDAEKPKQWYFMPGIASAFLCRMYMATGKSRYLELAEKYMEFAMRCKYLFSAPQVCKVGWGAALLYQVTRDHRYYDLAARVADYFIEHQYPEGYWINVAPYRELPHIIEITAEFVVHLDTILCALTT